jgi:hypothetical protein
MIAEKREKQNSAMWSAARAQWTKLRAISLKLVQTVKRCSGRGFMGHSGARSTVIMFEAVEAPSSTLAMTCHRIIEKAGSA